MKAHEESSSTTDDTDGAAEKPFDNLQTWPKSQAVQRPIGYRGLSDLHDFIRLESVLNQAKSFVRIGDLSTATSPTWRKASASTSGPSNNEDRLQAATRLIDTLAKELERRVKGPGSSTRVGMFRKRRESVGAAAATAASGRPRFNSTTAGPSIREDPHFESMIICDTLTVPTMKNYGSMDTVCSIHHGSRTPAAPMSYSDGFDDEDARDLTGLKSPAGNNVANLTGINVVAELPGESVNDPLLIRAVPHFLLLGCSLLYVIGGAYAFTWVDDQIAAKPFRVVLLFAFQTCTSIGWGDTWPSNSWSQLMCVIYTIFGVPIIFSAFANIGRLMTEFYCVDWIFLTAVVRERIKMYTDKLFPHLPDVQDNFQTVEVRRRFPIRATINLLFIHQCIGVVLYGSLIKQFTVIQVIYFSITSMATTGYGDIHPDPKTMTEAVVMIVYISSGIIIFSALLLSIAYYFQRVIYVTVPNHLHYCYERHRRRSAVAPSAAASPKK